MRKPQSTTDQDWFIEQVRRELAGLRVFVRMLGLRAEPDSEVFLEGVVVRLGGQSTDADDFVERVSERLTRGETGPISDRWSMRWWRGATIAVSLVCLVMTSLWWTGRQSAAPPVRVEVVRSLDAEGFVVGKRVELRDLKLVRGALQLWLESGVLLDCTAPVVLKLESPLRIRLVHGSLDVDVGDRGFGFTVVTPAGEVVDLRTEFRVAATSGGDVQVAVISGKVEVRREQSPEISVTEGEAVSVRQTGSPQRVQTVQLDRAADNARGAGRSILIESVADNLRKEGMHRFDGVVPGGMQSRVKVFVDRPGPKWKLLRGQAWPEEPDGADLVQTFQAERWDDQFALRLKVARACALFLLRDPRNPVPAGIERDFSDSGLRVRAHPWTGSAITTGSKPLKNAGFEIPFEVWKKNVTAAVVVSLGAPYDKHPEVPSAMCGIAVKAKTNGD
jgi:hypothetical protein